MLVLQISSTLTLNTIYKSHKVAKIFTKEGFTLLPESKNICSFLEGMLVIILSLVTINIDLKNKSHKQNTIIASSSNCIKMVLYSW